ncbi:PASTA [Moorella glycerini]|uniref:non-specific serine/threonine protein kinase n=1 Tax=Neomoorella stamsii TaxID=1266720 RepID=A0A9X7J2A0_9FIRM|nr:MULTISPECIES: Stk1 family PASTA domain-containing Ser/Thr kinase [Moorella]PRR72136.1 Serine/threonine-protein kinase PrkC [Moorella stamsii]CEP69437.1 PASTA [Moorella glycerini]
MDKMIGKILEGRYEIIDELGGGGMARVYRGQDRLLHRYVTIKILREQYASDKDFLTRFQREAQAVASLSHPNVVSIYDVGQEDGIHYLIMEYVEGRSLKDLITERAPLPPLEAIDIALQICDALEHAHENGVIHRDIKPHNILITRNGRVKVTDFGIAQAVNEATMSYNGTMVGSVHYLAPEQARGGVTGAAADIYSFGIVLYEMLTGDLPFHGETPVAVAIKHIQESPRPLREINPGVPPALERIVMRTLEKEPERRYPSAAALRSDLLAVRNALTEDTFATQVLPALEAPDPPASPARPRRRPRVWAWVLMVLLFLGLAAAGLWAGFRYYLLVGETVVPPVTGLTEGQAMDRLAAAGLRGQVGSRQYNAEIPAGQVMAQEPAAGERVRRGRVVTLTVSQGSRMVTVPPVVGFTEREARLQLENAGLRVVGDSLKVYHPSIPAGSVVEQNPPGNTKQPEGTEVRLIVSKGPEPQLVPAPRLIGYSLAEAQQQLAAAKLQQGTLTYQRSEEQFPGIVIDQDPRPGSSVLQGSAINLVVSQGPGPAQKQLGVTVPPAPDDKDHEVRIVVTDAKGTSEVLNKKQEKGQQIQTVITYFGKGKLQVFRDGNLIYVRDLP